jgi:hypothetical protein
MAPGKARTDCDPVTLGAGAGLCRARCGFVAAKVDATNDVKHRNITNRTGYPRMEDHHVKKCGSYPVNTFLIVPINERSPYEYNNLLRKIEGAPIAEFWHEFIWLPGQRFDVA